ncbi:PAS domain-containing protein [Curvivirga aplysinae]|uniref:hypothetical protein n=1 Tax=Curvivirga aplysinae TaxID=2529852 RepID=UPI0012BBB831|nr:hypothetical protein [Curvivirga aplysinae]MTI08901.1 hypothetical protein [Curvivirga aplysinae]
MIEVSELKSIDDLSMWRNQQIYEWWTNVPSGSPQKSDFKIENHIRIAGGLFLLQRLAYQKFKYLICGEEINIITGRQSHGFTFELKPPEYVGYDNFNQLIEHYEMIVETKKPYFCTGSSSLLGVKNSGFESIDCPLFDDEGNVTHIIGSLQLKKSKL